jgi:VWFA-related protein
VSQDLRRLVAATLVPIAVMAVAIDGRQHDQSGPDLFRFTGGVDFVTIHATITDLNGRFVANLHKDDFTVLEDGQPVELAYFSVERVPLSLGLALDTSDSMGGEKIKAARRAIEGLLRRLERPDETFLYRFGDFPILVQEWTTDRRLIERALDRVSPTGGTAMYDTIARAIPIVETGQNPKKALLVVSDGQDTASTVDPRALRQRIRESEALVYAVGIDGPENPAYRPQPRSPRRRRQVPQLPLPGPFGPGLIPRGAFLQFLPPPPGSGGAGGAATRGGDPANLTALRDLTDESGGRTAVIGDLRQLEQIVAGVADELGRQYFLGYSSPSKRDGGWHTIAVELKDASYRVRARRGYVAN